MFDEHRADKAVTFFEKYLTHTKGKWAGKPFMLTGEGSLKWQYDLIRRVFGTVDENGHRQYRKVYCEIPKKNGKSDIAAGIAVKLLVADGEQGGEIYSAAADRDQASIVFNIAAQMVRNNTALSRRLRIIDSQRRIIAPNTGSIYRVLSSDVETKHGFNASGVIFDELHAQPNRHLYDVLTDGAGDARTQPLFFYITTAGYDRNSVCWEVHEYARKVAAGIIDDPHFLPVLYCLDDDADWEDEKNWKKVNPSIGVTIDIEKVRAAYKEAKEIPAKENSFRRLRLNQWVTQETRFIPMERWDGSAGEPIDENELNGRTCYAGLDLSATTDVTALVYWFPPAGDWETGEHVIVPRFFIPRDVMELKIRRDHVPYDQWEKHGFVIATPGEIIDYRYVMKQIEADAEKFDIQELAFDRWGSEKIICDLQDWRGNPEWVVRFGQGYKDMNAPTKELYRLILGGNIRHGSNPVLRWMADNVMVTTDPAGNIKPDKAKSTQRIDGIVAAIMGLARAMVHKNKTSIYETRGVLRA